MATGDGGVATDPNLADFSLPPVVSVSTAPMLRCLLTLLLLLLKFPLPMFLLHLLLFLLSWCQTSLLYRFLPLLIPFLDFPVSPAAVSSATVSSDDVPTEPVSAVSSSAVVALDPTFCERINSFVYAYLDKLEAFSWRMSYYTTSTHRINSKFCLSDVNI